MNCLEQLIIKEHKYEKPLVFYSVSLPPPQPLPEPCPAGPDLPLESITAYSDELNKQCGFSSTSITANTSSNSVEAKTLDNLFSEGGASAYSSKFYDQMGFSSTSVEAETLPTYTPSDIFKDKSLNEDLPQVLNYISKVNEQLGASSTSITANTSSTPINAKTLDNLFSEGGASAYVSKIDEQMGFSSTSVKPADSPIYNPPEFKIPEIFTPKHETNGLNGYNNWIPNKDEKIFDSKHYKYFEDFNKNKVKTIIENKYTNSDFHNALDLFKNNELPKIYEQIEKNLHMRPKSVTTLTLTNPLYTKSAKDEGPVFIEDYNKKEIRLPITQPKFIPFIKTDQQKYRDIILNSFLPHEQAHANINKKYGHMGENEGLKGFNEHLANTMAKDSLEQPYVKAETEYQNLWAGNSETKSYMKENYHNYLKTDEDASLVPANIATVNMLENPWLKKKTDNILSNNLEKLYPNDKKFGEEISNDIYKLSKIYQTEALKITELSKKDTILSNFKAKRLLSDVEKYTFRFLEKLK